MYLMREYRRYYPAGEVAGHILGFTSVDDVGQEGLELAFDHWLGGRGRRQARDPGPLRHDRQNVEEIRACAPGADLVLSIDLRIQYLAYRELKAAIRDQRAKSGSVVVLDIATGEVLAMVNQPAYNPNDRDQSRPSAIAIAPPPTSSSRARASSRSSSPRAWPRALSRRHASSTPRRATCGSAPRLPTSTTSARSTLDDRARQVEQRRHDEDRAVARARQMYGDADRARLRPGDRPAATRASPPACCLATRTGGRSAADDVATATASRSRRCSSRMRTPLWRAAASAPDHLPARRHAAARRARARRAAVARMLVHLMEAWSRRTAAANAPRSSAIASPARPAPRGRPPPADTRRTATCGVRRRRAGEQPAARGRGDHRRAGRRQILRRRRRRARVLGRRGRRAAPARRAAGPMRRSGDDASTARPRWRRDDRRPCSRLRRPPGRGCSTASPRAARRRGHRPHAGRPRRASRAARSSPCPAARSTASRIAPQAVAAARARCCGSRRRSPWSPTCPPRSSSRRCRPARTRQRDRGPLLRRAVGATGGRRHHRHQRQDHLRLSTRAGARSRRPSRRVHGHDRHRPARQPHRERDSPPPTPSPCSARWPSCARRGAAMRGDGSVLACARPGARRRRAIPTPPCSPISRATISTITARWSVRRRQGAAVHPRGPALARDQRRRRLRPAARRRSARSRPRRGRLPRPPVAHAQRADSCAPCMSARRAASSWSSTQLGRRRAASVRWSATSTSTTC